MNHCDDLESTYSLLLYKNKLINGNEISKTLNQESYLYRNMSLKFESLIFFRCSVVSLRLQSETCVRLTLKLLKWITVDSLIWEEDDYSKNSTKIFLEMFLKMFLKIPKQEGSSLHDRRNVISTLPVNCFISWVTGWGAVSKHCWRTVIAKFATKYKNRKVKKW